MGGDSPVSSKPLTPVDPLIRGPYPWEIQRAILKDLIPAKIQKNSGLYTLVQYNKILLSILKGFFYQLISQNTTILFSTKKSVDIIVMGKQGMPQFNGNGVGSAALNLTFIKADRKSDFYDLFFRLHSKISRTTRGVYQVCYWLHVTLTNCHT